jgi:hypothetical protein
MHVLNFGRSQRIAALLIAFIAAVGGPARAHDSARGHRQEVGVVAGPVYDKIATLRYWSRARMDAAIAQDVRAERVRRHAPRIDVITPGGDESGQARVVVPYADDPLSRVAGKVFFHDPLRNMDAFCSASVVASKSQRLIVPAAHCFVLFEQDSSGMLRLVWMEHPMFVPAHDGTREATDEQRSPYGLWPLRRAFVAKTIEDDPTNILKTEWDLAVADTYDQLGRPIQAVLGAALSPRTSTAEELFPLVNLVSYPGEAYGGQSQYWCASTTKNSFSGLGLELPNCRNYPGSSGGSVVVNDKGFPTFAGSEVVAVVHNSGQYTRLWGYLYPPLANAADADAPHKAASP